MTPKSEQAVSFRVQDTTDYQLILLLTLLEGIANFGTNLTNRKFQLSVIPKPSTDAEISFFSFLFRLL